MGSLQQSSASNGRDMIFLSYSVTLILLIFTKGFSTYFTQGWSFIRDRFHGNYLSANGSFLETRAKDGSDDQLWMFDSDDRIVNRKNNLVLDGGSGLNATLTNASPLTKSKQWRWLNEKLATSDGRKCLQIARSLQYGSPVIMFHCHCTVADRIMFPSHCTVADWFMFSDCEPGYKQVLGRCFQWENQAKTYAADSNGEYAFVSGELAANITKAIEDDKGSGSNAIQLKSCQSGKANRRTTCILLKMTTGSFDDRLCQPQYSRDWCPQAKRRIGCPLCRLRKSDLNFCKKNVKKAADLNSNKICCAHIGVRNRLGLQKTKRRCCNLGICL